MIATRDGYGKGLLDYGMQNKNVVVIDADLGKSTRSNQFGKQFPERYINVGIAEQDMVVTSAGLASCNKIPFANSFAIFTERAYEQIRNSIARPNLNVKIIGSHGGILTGDDGASAQSIEDFAIYRVLPNMVVVNPADGIEAEKSVSVIAEHFGPVYMRLTREKLPILFNDKYKFKLGKGVILRGGKDVAIFSTGALVAESLKAYEELLKQGIKVYVVNIHTIKPIDKELIIKLAKKTNAIVTAEDHNIIGGLGSAVAEILVENYPCKMIRIGVKDRFGESGKPDELYKKYGLSSEHIVKAVKKILL
ncbi:MAG: transketolase family protein [Nanoarchaeota archaeon]